MSLTPVTVRTGLRRLQGGAVIVSQVSTLGFIDLAASPLRRVVGHSASKESKFKSRQSGCAFAFVCQPGPGGLFRQACSAIHVSLSVTFT
ncbi:hypothetical protein HBI56_210390 [Parastagonospora nodorum]|uniref:Uncharacterized protein n=1 Tax=Phaeosphaeria nodorum (strain SN15 / ATCC MYA-4574 / FGSC 10173) TaxID=321614 RepID=A0A7U2F364_PHANO|nr:hypothetical protein HBH56_213930 [Parastagonospora nodorum]QRC97823.1 hypothetical protein JI435_411080 [Parastagonospora nodorum SN15]KAH3923073.1 hypothetical protein HBH54_215600 [Parastagonospora nodorum]KAH3941849.1 hypothetical protein HBH53_196510 [Parastagonospora nodorum]KAH3960965.1 hypothetical protein HBH51_186340 [Parastagonospora nodorum]